MDIRYSYADIPTVKSFSQSDARIRGLMGPFGSGKSSGCVMEIVKRAAQQPVQKDGKRRSRWVIVRNTYGQLKDTTEKTFLNWLPPEHFGQWTPSVHNYLINKLGDLEIEIMFRALDRPDHVRNLLSLEITGAWVNEAREVPWSIIDGLDGRIGRYPARKDGGVGWYGIIMDTNPPDSRSRWYQHFEVARPDNSAIFKQPPGRSPNAENLSNLPEGYYENLAKGKDPEWVRVYVDGEYGFVIDGNPVYPEYRDSTHSKLIHPIPNKPIYRGWDFGLTPACVYTQLSPKGQWLVFDELVSARMGIERFADVVIPHTGINWPGYEFIDIGDPAGNDPAQTDERTCFEILKAKGIDIGPSPTQNPTLRIESVKKPLNSLIDGEPGMLIHPRCETLRLGFQGGYHYRRLQTNIEKYTDKPEKNEYSHCHDALQYVGVKLFGNALISSSTKEKVDYHSLYG